jgi:hypothetical protein
MKEEAIRGNSGRRLMRIGNDVFMLMLVLSHPLA